ncbi:DsbA family protein [Mycoplasmatota bacterium]|nr:DsbA family protein [Mycoplasmatota bacterium]
MTIEFYLDYLCPKCYLQHKIIESMVDHKSIDPNLIIYRSFEMVDEKDFDQSIAFADFISKYKHLPKEEVVEFLKGTNLDIKLFPIHHVHKMFHLAKRHALAYAYNQSVFKAIYEQHLDLSDLDILKKLSLSVGLPKDEVEQVLYTNKYSNAVISNKENGLLKGVHMLPFLRINKMIKLEGIQDEAIIIEALNVEQPKSNHEHCIGEHCYRKRVN